MPKRNIGQATPKKASKVMKSSPNITEAKAASYQYQVLDIAAKHSNPLDAADAVATAWQATTGRNGAASTALAGLVGFCLTPAGQKANKKLRVVSGGKPFEPSGIAGNGAHRVRPGIRAV